MLENEKRNRKFTFKKSNLPTWGEDELDSNDEKEKDEKALLYLMAFDDEVIDVFDSNLFYSNDDDDEIGDLYHKLYQSLVKAKKDSKLKISKNDSLVEKI